MNPDENDHSEEASVSEEDQHPRAETDAGSPDGQPQQGDLEENIPTQIAESDELVDPALPADAAELVDPESQAAEYLEGWQRARAEFSNYKKRVDRELQDAYARATGDVITRYLSILDDLERALKDAPTSGDAASWAEGVDLIYRKLKAMIEAEGVEVIEAEGQPFDPNLHEAIAHEESDELREGYVIDVVQQGYRKGDRVLRPALVRVAK